MKRGQHDAQRSRRAAVDERSDERTATAQNPLAAVGSSACLGPRL